MHDLCGVVLKQTDQRTSAARRPDLCPAPYHTYCDYEKEAWIKSKQLNVAHALLEINPTGTKTNSLQGFILTTYNFYTPKYFATYPPYLPANQESSNYRFEVFGVTQRKQKNTIFPSLSDTLAKLNLYIFSVAIHLFIKFDATSYFPHFN